MARSEATLSEIEEVYRRRSRDFYRFALARTGDPGSAQDAVQDGFARAIRARRSFRRTGSLEAWIGRCVLNAASGQRRRSRLQAPLPENFEPSVSDGDPPDTTIRNAVRELPARQRDAVFLRFYLDLDYAAIAEVLGVEVGTVSATLHAARQALAHTIEEVTP